MIKPVKNTKNFLTNFFTYNIMGKNYFFFQKKDFVFDSGEEILRFKAKEIYFRVNSQDVKFYDFIYPVRVKNSKVLPILKEFLEKSFRDFLEKRAEGKNE